MIFKIVDASVAVKWFVDEEEGREKALSILQEVEENPGSFGVPELFFNEMLAVFCKLSLSENEVRQYIQTIEELGFYRIGNGRELLSLAAHLALQYGITGYDAVYVACAKLTSGRWLTFDRQAHQRIKSLKSSSYMG